MSTCIFHLLKDIWVGLNDDVGGWAPGLKRSVYHAHPKADIQHICPLLQHQKGGASASSKQQAASSAGVSHSCLSTSQCFKMTKNWKVCMSTAKKQAWQTAMHTAVMWSGPISLRSDVAHARKLSFALQVGNKASNVVPAKGRKAPQGLKNSDAER